MLTSEKLALLVVASLFMVCILLVLVQDFQEYLKDNNKKNKDGATLMLILFFPTLYIIIVLVAQLFGLK